jgi:hypothetical protein
MMNRFRVQDILGIYIFFINMSIARSSGELPAISLNFAICNSSILV